MTEEGQPMKHLIANLMNWKHLEIEGERLERLNSIEIEYLLLKLSINECIIIKR